MAGPGRDGCRPAPADGTQTLTWDPEGRLATLVDGTTTHRHLYTADGTRLIRRDATGKTLYLSGAELRHTTGGSTVATRYYSYAGQICAMRQPGTGICWLASDHQGTQQITIAAGPQTITQRRQTPYGTPRGTVPTWPNPRGLVGGDIDPTGLTHLGAREYDPGLGRFISVDPIMDLADPQQWHGYAYANYSPITLSDPDGLKPLESNDSTATGTNDSCTGHCEAYREYYTDPEAASSNLTPEEHRQIAEQARRRTLGRVLKDRRPS